MTRKLDCAIPRDFHFAHTVFSHGWCALSPFHVQKRPLAIGRPLRLRNSIVVVNAVSASGGRAMDVTARSARTLGRAAERECAARVRSMFQLDLDLAPLYRRLRPDPAYAWMARARAGRMLRGDTFFEDVVKMILTTNCSWAFTTLMTRRLVDAFGETGPDGSPSFPTPDAIAGSSERVLRERISLGYRAPSILELARRCAAGSFDIEQFRVSSAPARELYDGLLSIRGVGPYAAGNLLKLLGRFDYLGLDSWCRAQYSRLHADGGAVSDDDIRSRYAAFEEWQGLVMWLDLTREWYRSPVPFST